MNAERVVCVSSGMLAPKKGDSPFARLHQYLNYGLLGLATVLKERGYKVSVMHGGFEDPETFVERQQSVGLWETRHPLLLSLPSSFSIPWARGFCAAARKVAPDLRIIVGGRWVTAHDGAWIRTQLPWTDLVVYGTAESRIERLLDQTTWQNTPLTDRTLLGRTEPDDRIPGLDFGVVDGFERYQPCVEVSRGCGMGCNFCAEASVKLTDVRPAASVARELQQLSSTYHNSGDIRPYFQASYFRPSTQWISDLRTELNALDVSLQWRAETRVDGLTPAQIAGLAATGLRVIDLGLESASPRQLERMHKTTNTSAYLRRASALLHACADSHVLAKVNVLFYPGETNSTIEETTTWLESHRSMIKGVSVGPMIVFRYGTESQAYLDSLRELGAYPVDDGALDQSGYSHLHLSPEISHDAALNVSQQLRCSFMSADDYFDLKSFSYFPRGFLRDDFDRLVATTSPEICPFRV